MSRRGPLTPEEREWASKHAAGAGAAAVLMFLHVVLVGYLICILWFLVGALLGREMSVSADWWWQVFLPAWVAVLTFLPTDNLTRGVGRVAMVTGLVTLVAAVAVWFTGELSAEVAGGLGRFGWLVMLFPGTMAAAGLLRWAFASVLAPYREGNMVKTEAD